MSNTAEAIIWSHGRHLFGQKDKIFQEECEHKIRGSLQKEKNKVISSYSLQLCGFYNIKCLVNRKVKRRTLINLVKQQRRKGKGKIKIDTFYYLVFIRVLEYC